MNRLKKRTLYLLFIPFGFVLFMSLDIPSDKHFDIAKNIEIYASVYAEVNKYYVDDINPNKFMKTGIDAMLETLDPYTNFIAEDDIEDYRFLSTGQYGGIGAVIGKRKGKTYVLMPYEGFPAHKSGLKIGDVLLEIDGTDVKDKNTGEISKLLKGQANTDVDITVERYGKTEPIKITITREKIKVKNVPYFGMVNKEVGYIKLKDFTRDASKEVKKGLLACKKDGAKYIILDLRGNPGGLLLEAISISNLFVDKGKEIVSTKGKVEKWNSTYEARDFPSDTDIPVVVLTSSRSASASEIVSGVLQDYDRAVLIGQRTFGKGLVQATKPTAYNTQIKVTTAKYYIPSGRCIQAIDYSHRNPDGSVGKFPDSLRKEFKTANGRKVYDGGGILPDIVTPRTIYGDISISLANKNMLFEYATIYCADKDTLASPKEFALTKTEYNAFVSWVKEQKDYTFKSPAEKSFADFENAIEKDSTVSGIEAEIKALKDKLKTDKIKEMEIYRDQIREMLEEEIVSRFYLNRGVIESSFDDDTEILEAVNLFKDMERYKKLLAPPN